jgi:lysozyme
MQRVKAKGQTVKGLDCSHYDGLVDFKQVKAAGYEFVWNKCTEGTGNADRSYNVNRAKASAAGMLFGAYHFFRPGLDPLKQAEWFLRNAELKSGDLQPVFDWESFQGPADQAKARIWLERVERACGRKPIIYGSPYSLNQLNLAPEFVLYPLWIAHYGTLEPLVPAPWKVWSFHQYTDRGAVPGIPATDEDIDRFNGPIENLRKFTLE